MVLPYCRPSIRPSVPVHRPTGPNRRARSKAKYADLTNHAMRMGGNLIDCVCVEGALDKDPRDYPT